MTKDILLVIDNSKTAARMIQAAVELEERYEAGLSIQVLSCWSAWIPAVQHEEGGACGIVEP